MLKVNKRKDKKLSVRQKGGEGVLFPWQPEDNREQECNERKTGNMEEKRRSSGREQQNKETGRDEWRERKATGEREQEGERRRKHEGEIGGGRKNVLKRREERSEGTLQNFKNKTK